jgi:hypothetical protein
MVVADSSSNRRVYNANGDHKRFDVRNSRLRVRAWVAPEKLLTYANTRRKSADGRPCKRAN